MAYGIEPGCRYGHGALVRQTDPQYVNHAGSFMAPTTINDKIQILRGYMFEIWKCTQCSYLELHDFPAENPP